LQTFYSEQCLGIKGGRMSQGKHSDGIIQRAVQSYNENDPDEEITHGEGTELFGDNGILDSVEILELLTLIEKEIEDETGKTVMVLDLYADYQDAVDQTPFKTLSTLSSYIEWVLAKEE